MGFLHTPISDTARHIYKEKGCEILEEEEHHGFGKDLIGQNWELKL